MPDFMDQFRPPKPPSPPLPQTTTANQDPTTASLLRRYRRRAGWWLGSGIVLFVVFVIAASAVETSGDELLRTGEQVTGVVLEIRSCRPRLCASHRSLVVEFPVEDQAHRGVVNLDDGSPEYRVGQSVEIFYDPSDPTHFRTEADVNQSPWTVYPMIFALLGGVAALVVGIVAIRRGRRFRRTLRQHPWRVFLFRYVMLGRSTPVISLKTPEGADEGVYRVSATWSAVANRLSRGSGGEIWVAGPVKDRMTLTLPGAERLFEARSPRNERTRRRWAELLLNE